MLAERRRLSKRKTVTEVKGGALNKVDRIDSSICGLEDVWDLLKLGHFTDEFVDDACAGLRA